MFAAQNLLWPGDKCCLGLPVDHSLSTASPKSGGHVPPGQCALQKACRITSLSIHLQYLVQGNK